MKSDYKTKLTAARAAREAHVRAWTQSGLSQAAYCAEHDLNPTTFSGWRLAQRVPIETSNDKSSVKPLTAVAINVERPKPAVHDFQSPSMKLESEPKIAHSVAPQKPGQIVQSHAGHRLHGARGWILELARDTQPLWLAQLLQHIEMTERTSAQ